MVIRAELAPCPQKLAPSTGIFKILAEGVGNRKMKQVLNETHKGVIEISNNDVIARNNKQFVTKKIEGQTISKEVTWSDEQATNMNTFTAQS